ncbi:hypothetical protein [Bradyrhizobium sp. BWA-3-5]|uniref:hypothetical protein n=1 Tax=Bradyrhizobium sp. BWA-3-5 TaxID=3080013 RepID=UPI00293F06A8|nr:hypothetical protein [Bradyrhizobium sp. BWA-3-5]WOH67433.1 hypothetical protein RX331_06695 [Bradyrhizobium sp. BWA-3-5]
MTAADRPITVQTVISACRGPADRHGHVRLSVAVSQSLDKLALLDMSHFTAEFYEYCADIALTVPSQL